MVYKSFVQFLCLTVLISSSVLAQGPGGPKKGPSPVSASTTAASSSPAIASSSAAASPTTTATGSSSSLSVVPDVYLNVPELHVGRIELDVDRLSANLNLNANVAQLVQINAGVAVSVEKVNITIADVDANLELVVRLGHLVDIVSRVFQSLDLNPLLINAVNDLTSLVDNVVGAVDGLLGSITQGGKTLSFLIDNLGNIVQEVTASDGSLTSSIVGNYLTNMTFTGEQQTLGNGDIQKTYSYSPLNALVNIIFNTAGQIVQAVVVKAGGGGATGGTGTSSTSAPTSTPTA